MMRTQKLSDRLLKRNYQGIILAIFMMMCVTMTHAQSLDSARVLSASYDADNRLVILLEIPADETIRDAFVLFDNEELSLDIENETPSFEQWFILDAGESMINSYSLIKDELGAIIENQETGVESGGISFGDDVIRQDPDNRQTLFISWLDDYQASATQSCVFDALNVLSELEESPRLVRRMMLITGTANEDSSCTGGNPELAAPVDIIVMGNPDDNLYRDIAEQSDGAYLQSTVLRLSRQIATIEALWNRPVAVLSLPVQETIPSADFVINFESGERFTQSIVPSGEIIITPTAAPTSIPPTSTATDIPDTAVIEATDTDVPVTETEATADVQIPAIEATATEIIVVPNEDATPPVSNSTLIFAGGIAAVVVVLIVMALLLGYGRGDASARLNATNHPSTKVPLDADSTVLPGTNVARLDQTSIVTMREIASQFGPTLVANLINEAADIIYEIHRPVSTLGRQIGSDILIAGDNQISREHVRFSVRDDGTIWITRMTRNPILVNGLPMETTRELNTGDLIQLSPNLQVIFNSINPQEQE